MIDVNFVPSTTMTELSNNPNKVIQDMEAEDGWKVVTKRDKPNAVLLTIDMYEKVKSAMDSRQFVAVVD